MTNNIDRAAEIIREADRKSAKDPDVMRYGGPDEHAQVLADNGLLMPDMPEPTFITGNAVVWKNDGDEVFLVDGEISIASAIRSPERSQRLALAVFAAANYDERNQE